MEYKLEEYVVAFIDILGASKKIKEDSENSLNIMHKVYQNALSHCEKIYDNEIAIKLKPIVKIYSDNIVVAVSTKPYGQNPAFVSVAILSAVIQHEFLQYNYLIRGGISMGDFFADEIMLWGNALLDAYYVESQISIYPRIVVHPETVSKLDLALDESRQNWIKQDSDGLFFIDYMQERIVKNDYLDLLSYRIQQCESLLIETTDVKSKQKILWHNTYLNSKLYFYSSNYSELLSQEIRKLEAKTAELEKR